MGEKRVLLHPSVATSIEGVHRKVPGSIGDMMEFQVVKEDREKGEYILRCKTEFWMRNVIGTLHGGIGALIMDQAMGFVAYSYMTGLGTTPTIQMQLNYHRPLTAGEDVLVRIRVISVTRTLVTMISEAMLASDPDTICVTASATFYLRLDHH